MLKALELHGFKSFADRTRFEFPPGITVIVGPNGSGKSNVVDAIKWVLGEQSAKSLRGSDMADVIFKGSGSGAGSGRKVMNAAEATLVFDNAERRLPFDAPEVHVTRRLYRGGEGEYLINRQPCRLKDIKDMFRGTGVGTDAYSLIEQGKVDRMLQASAKDRRAMFEEAAGISRFKAKKVEAQRRMERVDQNLLRLRDIVEEVENRLRAVRSQAAKAQRYREYFDRLQQLRTHVGQVDWRQLSDKLMVVEADLTRHRDETSAATGQIETLEARAVELEGIVRQSDELIRAAESQFTRVREQIMAREAGSEHEQSRLQDYEAESNRYRMQLQTLAGRAGDLHERLQATAAAISHAEGHHGSIRQRLAEQEQSLADVSSQLDNLRHASEQQRNRYVDQMRQKSALQNDATSLQSQMSAAESTIQRRLARLDELEQTRQEQAAVLEEAQAAEQQLATEMKQLAEQLAAHEQELADNRRLIARRQEEFAVTQGRHSGALERISILEEVERNHQDLNDGVKELLNLRSEILDSRFQNSDHTAEISNLKSQISNPTSETSDLKSEISNSKSEISNSDSLARRASALAAWDDAATSPFAEVRGLVADLIQAPVDLAPLIDVALGDLAQYLVVDGEDLFEAIQDGNYQLLGRVGFVPLEVDAPRRRADHVDLSNAPGVVDRADRLIETSTEFQPLVHRLLGSTWLVETLADALAFQHLLSRGVRFVTRAGELLERDGTLLTGPRHAALGLVLRRSELRKLREEVLDLAERIRFADTEVARLQENVEQQGVSGRRLADRKQKLGDELVQRRAQSLSLSRQLEQAERQRKTAEAEVRAARAQCDQASVKLDDVIARLATTETSVQQMEAALREHEQRVEMLDLARQLHIHETTRAKIEFAKSEQLLERLQHEMSQFEADQRERARALVEARQQLEQSLQRRQQSERQILKASSELAELYLKKESLGREIVDQQSARETLLAERNGMAGEVQKQRKRIRKFEDKLHQQELAANEIRHQRTTLADRLRDDYGLDVAVLSAEPESAADLENRGVVEQEITELRQTLNAIGAVNLDALSELDELDARFAKLNGQYQDLVQAKESLERIITKINTDSRRLFTETLDAIRTNFQSLYRKAFGGGHADLQLEQGVDVLEGGVDIIATPPGKPSFSNTLLSGGEKALTAVALLMAIFQFRPSPFCILDEVDAPFDEANIGRFVDVLKGFLGWTRFVIVTHSKKTMTASTTLYGVTMQESGVSKRVSVRFEDVSDDGHISQAALDREVA